MIDLRSSLVNQGVGEFFIGREVDWCDFNGMFLSNLPMNMSINKLNACSELSQLVIEHQSVLRRSSISFCIFKCVSFRKLIFSSKESWLVCWFGIIMKIGK